MKGTKLAVFLGMVVLALPLSVWASSACNLPTSMPSNGEKLDFDFVAPATTNYYQFVLTAGHSYSIAQLQDYDDTNTDIPAANVKLWSDPSSCVAQVTIPPANVTTTIDPALPANGYRFSFIPTTSGTYELSIQNGGTTGRYIALTVSETTLYSPSFFQGSGYLTSYTLVNSTGAPIGGTLTLTDTTGATVGTSTISMPAKGAALVDTNNGNHLNATPMTVAAGKTGGATFAFIGPPGAVQGAAFLQNFNSSPPFTQPFELKPLRQGN